MSNVGERFRRDFRRRHYRIPRYDRNDIQPRGQCAHCNIWTLRKDLREQDDYRGGQAPVGLGFFVCPRCYFKPNPQGAIQTLPPDPEVVELPWPNTVDFSYTPPVYAWPLLPNPSVYQVGYQISVTGLEADAVICYADGDTWRNYDTDAVVEYLVLQPQTVALEAQMLVQPTHDRTLAIDAFMAALVSSGVYANSDLIYTMAAANAQAAGLNWAAPQSHPLIPTGSPAFTADFGYAGTATGYLDTGLNVLSTTFFKQATASISWYRAAGGLSSVPDIGISISPLNVQGIGASGSPAVITTRLGSTFALTFNASSTGPSLYCVSRFGTTLKFFQNGVLLGSIALANQALHSANFLLLNVTGTPSTVPLSYGRYGASVTDAQAAAEYAGLSAYLAAL